MTKQVELVVRFNFTVPIAAKTESLFMSIPLEQIQIKDSSTVEQKPLECKGNEYETMDVYEPS